MGKNEIISSIGEQYSALNIKYAAGGSADITVDQEVLDAKFATGKAKIHYESSMLVSEKDQTVYLWALTKEIKSGFSFGFSGESTFQSGNTLFRKVKAVQYTADGKAYEVEFDIGQLTKIVKEAATMNGYKYKTVLSKKKASF